MWIIAAGFIFILLNIASDLIIYRFLKPKYPKLAAFIYLIYRCVVVYSLAFLIVFSLRVFDFHELKWGFYIFFLLSFPKVFFALYWLVAVFPVSRFPGVKNISMYAGIFLQFIVFFLILHGGLIGRTKLQVKEIEIVSDRVPGNFDGFRIVQFSDSHLGSFENKKSFIHKLVGDINSLRPDVVMFTGDLVNDRVFEVLPFKEILSAIKADYGVFSVLGNHDYGDYYPWENLKEKEDNLLNLMEVQREMGWLLLNDEHIYLYKGTDSLAVVGVQNWGDPPFKQYGDLRAAYEGISEKTYSILLSHNPAHWRAEVLAETNIDLTLAGHTHAMQVRFWNISPSALRYKEWAGLFTKGTQYLYVNQGLGSIFLPMRVGAYPEITVITLKQKKQND